jgi:hypothetical protein
MFASHTEKQRHLLLSPSKKVLPVDILTYPDSRAGPGCILSFPWQFQDVIQSILLEVICEGKVFKISRFVHIVPADIPEGLPKDHLHLWMPFPYRLPEDSLVSYSPILTCSVNNTMIIYGQFLPEDKKQEPRDSPPPYSA